jgi:hypothetical protein
MSLEDLIVAARTANAEYRQYDRMLLRENCQTGVARRRRSKRGAAWYEKGEEVLIVGPVRLFEGEAHVTIWSTHKQCFCLVPAADFRKDR